MNLNLLTTLNRLEDQGGLGFFSSRVLQGQETFGLFLVNIFPKQSHHQHSEHIKPLGLSSSTHTSLTKYNLEGNRQADKGQERNLVRFNEYSLPPLIYYHVYSQNCRANYILHKVPTGFSFPQLGLVPK